MQLVENKKVLFITTKNIDYIRNSQELKILNKYAESVETLYSKRKNNPLRIIEIWLRLHKKRVERADILFIGFEPQFVIPFKKNVLKGKIIIADFFISVYDTLVWDRKIIKDKSFLANWCHNLDEITLHRADLLIADTKAHGKYFMSEFNGHEKCVETIYLEADEKIYYPREQRKCNELKNKFVVLYFGSILPLQGVEVVLDAIRELKDQQDVYFDIIGKIPDRYNKPIQDNVCYTDWLSQEKLAEHIANADLCLAGHFNDKIEKAKRTIAGKTYIYEAMNKLIILGDNAANREMFSEDKTHFFVAMGDPKVLADAVLKAKINSEV